MFRSRIALQTILYISTILAVTSATGCRTMMSVVEAHEAHEGTERVYPLSPAEAQVLARKVLAENGAETIHEEPGRLLASWAIQPHHYGTFAGVMITEAPGGARVSVATRRTYKFQWFTTLTESGFHKDLERLIQNKAAR